MVQRRHDVIVGKHEAGGAPTVVSAKHRMIQRPRIGIPVIAAAAGLVALAVGAAAGSSGVFTSADSARTTSTARSFAVHPSAGTTSAGPSNSASASFGSSFAGSPTFAGTSSGASGSSAASSASSAPQGAGVVDLTSTSAAARSVPKAARGTTRAAIATPTKHAVAAPTTKVAVAAPAVTKAVTQAVTKVVVGNRLFGAGSLWNTVKSIATFAAAADATLRGETYGINDGDYRHPTYFAKASDPVTTFHLGAGWGFPATTITTPAPAGMHAASGSDAVMTVLLADGRLLDMLGVSGSGTNWTAHLYGLSDGVNGAGFGANGHAIGTTAIGSPQGAGTILARDVAAGRISHALCIAFPSKDLGGSGTGGARVAPAVNSDANGGGPLPQGGLLLIPAGTPKPAGLSTMGSALWDAAARYGVYITDTLGGPPSFYGDGSVASAFKSSDFTTVGKALRLAKTW